MSENSPRILIIRSGAIGDTLMVTPLLRSLRVSFPNAYLGVVTSAPAADALHWNRHVDDVFPLAMRRLPRLLSLEKYRIVRAAKQAGVDIVISLESDPTFTSLALAIGAERVITYDAAARGMSVTIVEGEKGEHSIDRHLRSGERIGAKPAGRDMELSYPPENDDVIREMLGRFGISHGDRLVGIHAGWGRDAIDPIDTRLRSWPGLRFAEIVTWLQREMGVNVILTGSERDRPVNDFIINASGVPAVNAAGALSLSESAALIRRMDLLISVDSGPAHMAAALGTPLLSLWGPGIYTATRPVSEKGIVRILRSEPPCAPCYGTPLVKICRDNICMKQLSAMDVRAAAAEILAIDRG